MIDQLPLERILKAALSQGGDFAEIFAEHSSATSIINDDKRLESILSTTDAGVGIRVLYGTKTAYGSSNDIDSLIELAGAVAKAAKKESAGTPLNISFRESRPRIAPAMKKHPLQTALKRKVDAVLAAADSAWKTGREIQQVRVAYKDKVRLIEIANSDGLLARDEQVETLFIVHAVASNGEILQTGYEPVGGSVGFELLEKNKPEEIAILAAGRAIRLLNALPAKAGPMPVILSSDAGGTMIHEAVGHGLEADLALLGLSVYTGRIKQKVASPLITVLDDATLPGRRGSFVFDDEGSPSQRTCLIENGILKGYLNDRVSAIKGKTVSTGNGRRQSYQHPPIVRMTNIMIAPGKDDPKDIVSSTHSGIFVTRMGGGQVNTVNGDFIFEIQEGYRIENGKIGEPIRGSTLIGNGPKVLEIIDRVGSDLGFSIGTCGKNGQDVPVASAQPTIRIPEIVVGGTK
jgi:TldD protein